MKKNMEINNKVKSKSEKIEANSSAKKNNAGVKIVSNTDKNKKTKEDSVKPTIIVSLVFIVIFFIINYIDVIIDFLSNFFNGINFESNSFIRESIAGIFLISTLFAIFLSILADNLVLKNNVNSKDKTNKIEVNNKFNINIVKGIAFILCIALCIIFYKNTVKALVGIIVLVIVTIIVDRIYEMKKTGFISPLTICTIYIINIIIFTFAMTGYKNNVILYICLILFVVFVILMGLLVKFKPKIDELFLTSVKVAIAGFIAYWGSLGISFVSVKGLLFLIEFIKNTKNAYLIVDVIEHTNFDFINIVLIFVIYWMSSKFIIDIVYKNYLSEEDYGVVGYRIHRFNNLSNLIFMILVFIFIKTFDIGLTENEINMITDAITLVSLLILFIDKRKEIRCGNNNICCKKD